MSGKNDAGRVFRTDGRQKVGFPPGFVVEEDGLDIVLREIVPHIMNQVEIRVLAGGVERHELVQDIDGKVEAGYISLAHLSTFLFSNRLTAICERRRHFSLSRRMVRIANRMVGRKKAQEIQDWKKIPGSPCEIASDRRKLSSKIGPKMKAIKN